MLSCWMVLDVVLLYGICSIAAVVTACLKALHLALSTHLAKGICESQGILVVRSLIGRSVVTCLWNLVQCAGVVAEMLKTILPVFFCLAVCIGRSPIKSDLVK